MHIWAAQMSPSAGMLRFWSMLCLALSLPGLSVQQNTTINGTITTKFLNVCTLDRPPTVSPSIPPKSSFSTWTNAFLSLHCSRFAIVASQAANIQVKLHEYGKQSQYLMVAQQTGWRWRDFYFFCAGLSLETFRLAALDIGLKEGTEFDFTVRLCFLFPNSKQASKQALSFKHR